MNRPRGNEKKAESNKMRPEREKMRINKVSGQAIANKIEMIDIAGKRETLRTAEARGEVRMSEEVFRMILENRLPKGDVLTSARLAGITAAKKASELIPLCHPLRITSIDVEVAPDESRSLLEIKSLVKAVDRTGVEMEALTAVAVACLTVYDMSKAFDKRMVIGEIHLVSKSGGKTGTFKW